MTLRAAEWSAVRLKDLEIAMKRTLAFAAAAALAVLAGCETTTPPPSNAPLRTGSAADEAVCLAAVGKEMQTSDTFVISSEFSQANTEVVVGVGPQAAKWRCLVSGGKVVEIMSLTNEGAA